MKDGVLWFVRCFDFAQYDIAKNLLLNIAVSIRYVMLSKVEASKHIIIEQSFPRNSQ